MDGLYRNFFMVLALILSATQSFGATTDWRNNRLSPLRKVTVGPSDNYQTALDQSAQTLYFTRTQNQVSQIYRQDLSTGVAQRLLFAETDAKDPAISPDGRWLAMTSFRQDAQGDICLHPLKSPDQPRCITDPSAMEQTPFWLDDHQLGYIRRPMMAAEAELVIEDLDNASQKVIVRGNVAAPAASPDGRYLVYHLRGEKTGIYLYDVQQNSHHGPLPLALPGISSYARFSPDSRYLYFGHYLNDTSADQSIDGDDHSVIFRAEVAALLQAREPFLPEQLISVEQNCNFPLPVAQSLYVTCAYEGSLDIYRIASEGMVPARWDEAQIQEAHRTARSYEDRLLLLNTLRFRFGDKTPAQLNALLERQLGNHLEIGEYSAAGYFVDKIAAFYRGSGQPDRAHFYFNLAIFLAVRSEALQQPPGFITNAFRLQAEQQRKRLRMDHHAGGGAVFSAWIDTLLQQNSAALQTLTPVWEYDGELMPLAYYLAVELSRQLLPPAQLLPRLLLASRQPTIGLESRLFYAFEYLRLLTKVEPDRAKRKAVIQTAIKQLQEQKVIDLFANEVDVIRIIQAEEMADKRHIFTELSTRLKGYAQQQDIRRIAHIRAITLLGGAGEYTFMELMSRHWLSVADVKEMAFSDIAEQYSIVTMNKAYGLLNDGDVNTAANTFYSAIRQTNDLEAHYAYVVLGLTSDVDGLRARMEKAYEILAREDLLGPNRTFVDALRLLLTDGSAETLQNAAALLEGFLPVGLTPALRDLLLGYVYQRQLQMGRQGYHFDKELYQKTHYQYMLALDQAYDNERVQAAVLENLGRLHFDVGNYGLSSDFFAERAAMPFGQNGDEAVLRWHLARSLFYYNNLSGAAKQADVALELAQRGGLEDAHLAFRQQAAFYHMQAGAYEKAATLYEKVIADSTLQGVNQAKATLGYGYTLFKLQRRPQAKAQFQKLLSQTAALKPLPADNDRLISFEPQRLQLLAYGLLAHCSSDPTEKADYLAKRIALLDGISDRVEAFAYDEKRRLEFVIKALQQEALAYEQSGLLQQMTDKMASAVTLLDAYIEEGGGYNTQTVIRTLTNYLSLALLHPQSFRTQSPPQLQPLINATVDALTLTPYSPPMSSLQRFELQLLHAAYGVRVTGSTTKQQLEQLLSQLPQHHDWQALSEKRTDLAEELAALVLWIRGSVGTGATSLASP